MMSDTLKEIAKRAVKKLNSLDDDEITFKDLLDVQTIVKNAITKKKEESSIPTLKTDFLKVNNVTG